MTLLEEAAPGKPGKRDRLGATVVVLVIVLLAVLVAGGYAAAHQVAGDKVPLGTTVSGVDIGGKSRADAIAELQEAFAARGAEPIRVEVEGGRSDDVRPDEIGLAIDYAATVDAAGAGDSWSPERQWEYFTGGDDLEAIVDVDETLLSDRLAELSEGLGVPPKDGRIVFEDGRVSVVDPVPGEAVDTDAAEEAHHRGVPRGGGLHRADGHPGPARHRRQRHPGSPRRLRQPGAGVRSDPGVRRVRGPAAAEGLREGAVDGPRGRRAGPADRRAQDHPAGEGCDVERRAGRREVELVNGKPKVIPAKPGVEFEPEDVVTVFTGLLSAPEGERTGEVKATVREADFTTKDAKALGIKQKVSEFVTYYPYAEYRNINIGRAAELIDGTILKPGETFSLNGTVGERTAENGFTIGYVISNGVLVKDYGGGVSQMATTTFNAMFFAGPRGHRAQAALVLHRPLPGGPRGDRRLALGRPEPSATTPTTASSSTPRSRRAPTPPRVS